MNDFPPKEEKKEGKKKPIVITFFVSFSFLYLMTSIGLAVTLKNLRLPFSCSICTSL
jgi:hypothetical protein